MRGALAIALPLAVLTVPPVEAQRVRRPTLQAQLDRAVALIEEQRDRLDRQAAEIAALRGQVEEARALPPLPPAAAPRQPAVAAAQGAAPGLPGDPGAALQPPVQQPLERVGQASADEDRPIELAVLDGGGSVITRRGQLTGELQVDYARADRNRAVFRGIELVEGGAGRRVRHQRVAPGCRQRLRRAALRAAPTAWSSACAYPCPSRRHVDPAPISGSTPDDAAATIDSSTRGTGVGDIELSARYQLTQGREGVPYLIANLQGVFPTGSDPFAIPQHRGARGARRRERASGASHPASPPSCRLDPVVLFGTLGYTFNLGKSVSTQIPPVIIDYVDPADAVSGSAGIGISFNQRTTINLGYAHTWAFGTKTRTRLIEPTPAWPGHMTTVSRDLQVGRFLFGVTCASPTSPA
ncbi:hypothetical protein AB5I41_08880 [Sphingomonas sp. MMS24-JH45]